MRAAEITAASSRLGLPTGTVCKALDTMLPLLHTLAASSGGWKFWLRWGVNALIGALEEWRAGHCVDIPRPAPPEA